MNSCYLQQICQNEPEPKHFLQDFPKLRCYERTPSDIQAQHSSPSPEASAPSLPAQGSITPLQLFTIHHSHAPVSTLPRPVYSQSHGTEHFQSSVLTEIPSVLVYGLLLNNTEALLSQISFTVIFIQFKSGNPQAAL